jgi:hypothetical protein
MASDATTPPGPLGTSPLDLTGRFDADGYRRGARVRWALVRAHEPAQLLVLHHAGGWYGAPLGADARVEEEQAQLDALARDHAARFGIGPGYHYAAFPSGRAYAVGMWGTHHAHVRGRDPASRTPWNRVAIGVVARGDYEAGRPTPALVVALGAALREASELAGRPVALLPQGGPAVNAAGAVLPPSTRRPGRWLIERLGELSAVVASARSPDSAAIAAIGRGLAAAREGLDSAERAVASAAGSVGSAS